MIPNTQITDIPTTETQTSPTRTYKINFLTGKIAGMVDGLDAVTQALQKIIKTSRYAYVIYTHSYGNELDKLVGQPYELVITESERMLKEALLADDRVLSVSDFHFTKVDRESLEITCIANTIYGNINLSTII